MKVEDVLGDNDESSKESSPGEGYTAKLGSALGLSSEQAQKAYDAICAIVQAEMMGEDAVEKKPMPKKGLSILEVLGKGK